jgi:hypothetical protein
VEADIVKEEPVFKFSLLSVKENLTESSGKDEARNQMRHHKRT